MGRASKRKDRSGPNPPSWLLLYHPQRGALLIEEGVSPESRRHRGSGGADSGWRELARVEMVAMNGWQRPAPTQRPPKGFLWGDPDRQVYGLSGPLLVFGPLEKKCRDCGASFVLTASEQKHLAETLQRLTLVTTIRCRACRRAKIDLERARKEYAAALSTAERA